LRSCCLRRKCRPTRPSRWTGHRPLFASPPPSPRAEDRDPLLPRAYRGIDCLCAEAFLAWPHHRRLELRSNTYATGLPKGLHPPVLLLLDRGKLARQAEKEFQAYCAPDANRKFTESSKVVIATIQRVDSMLNGEPELDPTLEVRLLPGVGRHDPPGCPQGGGGGHGSLLRPVPRQSQATPASKAKPPYD